MPTAAFFTKHFFHSILLTQPYIHTYKIKLNSGVLFSSILSSIHVYLNILAISHSSLSSLSSTEQHQLKDARYCCCSCQWIYFNFWMTLTSEQDEGTRKKFSYRGRNSKQCCCRCWCGGGRLSKKRKTSTLPFYPTTTIAVIYLPSHHLILFF